jgi:hypothetical protein
MTNENKSNPKYTGSISDGLQNKIGTIAVWQEEQETDKSPLFTGKIQVEGVNYRVALWNFKPKVAPK